MFFFLSGCCEPNWAEYCNYCSSLDSVYLPFVVWKQEAAASGNNIIIIAVNLRCIYLFQYVNRVFLLEIIINATGLVGKEIRCLRDS